MQNPLGGWTAMAVLVLSAACGGARSASTSSDMSSEVAAHGDGQVETTEFAPDLNVVLLAMTRTPQGIYSRDIVEGTGVPAMPGREVLMTYIAYLADGTEVDRTTPGAHPLAFTVGEGVVIRGWDLGVRGMRTGGTRQLVVPSRYAYGSRAVGKVPANAVMVFLVRLDGVR